MSAVTQQNIAQVREFLLSLQIRICEQLEAIERAGGVDGASQTRFVIDDWARAEGGGGRSMVLSDGKVIEKAGVMFSHIGIQALPPSASQRYPHLVGAAAQALGVSLVIHPRNPHVPTSHANVRLFVATPSDGSSAVWWFGGGFDLTPFYPVLDDVVHWHHTCQALCAPFGETIYPKFKAWCDEYFYLKHRDECRGVAVMPLSRRQVKTSG